MRTSTATFDSPPTRRSTPSFVNRAGHQLLAGAGFAQHQHRGVARGDAGDPGAQLDHGRALADEGSLARADLLAQAQDFAPEGADLGKTIDVETDVADRGAVGSDEDGRDDLQHAGIENAGLDQDDP
jgi:hypothetical protein